MINCSILLYAYFILKDFFRHFGKYYHYFIFFYVLIFKDEVMFDNLILIYYSKFYLIVGTYIINKYFTEKLQ